MRIEKLILDGMCKTSPGLSHESSHNTHVGFKSYPVRTTVSGESGASSMVCRQH
jgi:hypothetical protein